MNALLNTLDWSHARRPAATAEPAVSRKVPMRKHLYVRPTDEDLLREALASPEAFAAFYRRYERVMLAYFARRVGRGEAAADLAAETFARALASLDRFDADRGRAEGWLFGIAANVLARSARRRRIEADARVRLGMRPLAVDDETVAIIERLGSRDIGEHALQQLAHLPATQQEAIRRRVLEVEDYEAIGQDLECSPEVVRQRVSRGLSTLRKALVRQ